MAEAQHTMKQDLTPKEYWERLAQLDPLWAILSDPAKKGRGWTLEAFFETGRREISLLFYQLAQLGLDPRRGRALDFGCGVGRLSQALGELFDEVVGVDISPTMVRLARLANRHGTRVQYVQNDTSGLGSLTGGFDFIYSNIVLQHIAPEQSLAYVREFFRLAAPGGVVVFQLPSHKRPAESLGRGPNPMPDEAYRQRLEAGSLPETLEPGQETTIRVTVGNASSCPWIQADAGAIRLGNHWLDAADARMVVQDDGRVTLRERLEPGESETLLLVVRAPGQDGRYVCEIDLVHEGITWFGDRGALALRVPVEVRSGRAPGSVEPPAHSARREERLPAQAIDSLTFYSGLPEPGGEAGDFPMFGLPLADVREAVRDAGCTLVHCERDERAGPEWVAYRYFVSRPS